MSVQCPACGFESPEGSGWCDFCKEPFNRKRAQASTPLAPPAPPPVQAPRPPERNSIPPEVLERLSLMFFMSRRAKSMEEAPRPPVERSRPEDLPLGHCAASPC